MDRPISCFLSKINVGLCAPATLGESNDPNVVGRIHKKMKLLSRTTLSDDLSFTKGVLLPELT